MKKNQIIRCFLVSFVVTIVLILLPSTIMLGVEEELLPDISHIESSSLENMTETEIDQVFINAPMKSISGIDKLLYPFQHPQFILFFFQSFLIYFIGVFIATLTAMSLN